jgi:predicted nucleic acid-binding protein
LTVLDSNIVIYTLAGRIAPLPAADYAVSCITVIECLGFQGLSSGDVAALEEFFNTIRVIQTDAAIVEAAINLKRKYSVRTPDALILATAQAYGSDLLSNDLQLQRVVEVPVRSTPLI